MRPMLLEKHANKRLVEMLTKLSATEVGNKPLLEGRLLCSFLLAFQSIALVQAQTLCHLITIPASAAPHSDRPTTVFSSLATIVSGTIVTSVVGRKTDGVDEHRRSSRLQISRRARHVAVGQ